QPTAEVVRVIREVLEVGGWGERARLAVTRDYRTLTTGLLAVGGPTGKSRLGDRATSWVSNKTCPHVLAVVRSRAREVIKKADDDVALLRREARCRGKPPSMTAPDRRTCHAPRVLR